MDTKKRIYTVLTPGTRVVVHDVRDGNKIVATTFEGEDLEVTDSYHTMEELYQHRYHLYLALIKAFDSRITPLGSNVICWKSKLHEAGMLTTEDMKQIRDYFTSCLRDMASEKG